MPLFFIENFTPSTRSLAMVEHFFLDNDKIVFVESEFLIILLGDHL